MRTLHKNRVTSNFKIVNATILQERSTKIAPAICYCMQEIFNKEVSTDTLYRRDRKIKHYPRQVSPTNNSRESVQ
jgi:hypothetical protein